MEIIVKILKKGDEVINVWHNGSSYYIAVRQKNGEVYVCSVSLDEHKMPRIDKIHPLTITYGDGEVEANIPTSEEKNNHESSEYQKLSSNKDKDLKITTF